jgi:hypothetical protein
MAALKRLRTECCPVEPGSLWEAELPWEAGPPEKPHRFITPWKPLPFLDPTPTVIRIHALW